MYKGDGGGEGLISREFITGLKNKLKQATLYVVLIKVLFEYNCSFTLQKVLQIKFITIKALGELTTGCIFCLHVEMTITGGRGLVTRGEASKGRLMVYWKSTPITNVQRKSCPIR